MTNFKVFSIPKDIIPNTLPNPQTWERYDANCNRGDIKLDDSILDKILSFSNTRLKRNKKNYTVHYVKYSINDTPYIIDEHQDWCKFTLIVYLDKSPEVSDEFWVNDEKVEENVWVTNGNNYKCLAFWGNAPHRGKVFGKGKRDILCFFSD